MEPATHRTAHGAKRIKALTDTATELFLERGYEGVSVDAILNRVGGSRRNVYDRFGGKEGLFIDVVTKLCNEQAQPLREMEIEGRDLDGSLVQFGEKILEIVLQPRTLALHRLMIAEGQRFPELSQAILRSGHEVGVEILADWLRTRNLLFRENISASTFADQFIFLLTAGPQLRALSGQHDGPLSTAERERISRETVLIFLHGILPGDTPHAE